MVLLQTLTTPPLWLELIRSPAVVLAAFALVVRWVVAPALATYTRHELQTELKLLAAFPIYVDRVERLESAMERISTMPEQLGRIEEKVDSLEKANQQKSNQRGSHS